MALLAALLSAQIYQLMEAARLVDHTDQVIAKANETLKLMVDQETGERGYLVGKNRIFLQRYHLSREAIPDALNALQHLTKDNPEQQQRLVDIRAGYDAITKEAEATIGLLESDGDYVPRFNTAYGKRLMDAERGRFDVFTQSEEKFRLERNEVVQARAKYALGSAAGATLLVGGLMAFFTRSRLALLGSTYREAIEEEKEAREKEAEARRLTQEKAEEVEKLNAELELRVRARTIALESTNRELEAFSYSVSHDLRAPLRSIDGFSAALLEDYGETIDSLGQSYLARIRANSQTMADLIDGLLTLSRLTRSEMRYETVDLSEIARDVLRMLRERDPQRKVNVRIQDGLTAHGDPRLLRNVLENLLGNAWKFTAKRDDAQISFGASQENGETVFSIKDNGAGFDMAYSDKLFGAFQRLHKATEYDGTGIGLATVQRIIRRHGGSIRAEAAVGEGAAFYFTLPPQEQETL